MKNYKRIVCALETWIKEIQESDIKQNKCVGWILNTYFNEIQNGDYVSDEEYSDWIFQESKDDIN